LIIVLNAVSYVSLLLLLL